jgi:putative DNA primase/helicase
MSRRQPTLADLLRERLESQRANGTASEDEPKQRRAAPVREPATAAQDDGPRMTDCGNTLRLVQRHGADLRHCWPWRKWLAWDGCRWRVDDTGEVARLAKGAIAALYADAVAQLALLGATEGDGKGKAVVAAQRLLAHAVKSEAAPRINAMLDLARSESGITVLPAVLDSDPFSLNVANGTLDLRSGDLRQHNRDDMLTKLCPTAYRPEATCPSWERFLEDVFPATSDAAETRGDLDLIGYLQRLLGYCLTGDVREQILPIFFGGGGNGKSTLLNVLQDVIGADYAMKAAPDLLTVKRDTHPTERADLFGRRLVVAAETEQGARLAESLAKELTGGDRIRARRMREDFWEFAPTHKVILCTNHKPQVRGGDHAIWRRLRLVPFVVTIPDEQQDKQLPEKLRAEAEGILAWLVRGCLAWQRDGLGTASAVTAATGEYRTEEDTVGAFLTDRATFSDAYRCRASMLYSAYKCWCERTGEHVLGQRDFGLALSKIDGVERYGNNGIWYRGIGFRHDTDE